MQPKLELLSQELVGRILAGDRQALAQKPLAVFDVCPSPPLIWSNFGAQNLMDLARAKSCLTELLAAYERPSLPAEQERELYRLVTGLGREAGMAQLPEVE